MISTIYPNTGTKYWE